MSHFKSPIKNHVEYHQARCLAFGTDYLKPVNLNPFRHAYKNCHKAKSWPRQFGVSSRAIPDFNSVLPHTKWSEPVPT